MGSNYPCIFCGNTKKLSREHLFPKWLKQYMPTIQKKTPHFVSFLGNTPRPGKINRPGAHRDQTLRVACKTCNNGWMSRLQDKAKVHVRGLVLGKWPEMDKSAAQVVSAWAIMTVMVHEFAHPETATIPQAHRDILRLHGVVPPDWFVWLGRIDSGSWQTSSNHHGALIPYVNNYGRPTLHHLQSTGFVVGKALFQTAMLTPPIPTDDLTVNPEQFASGYHLRQLYPQPADLTDPVHVHDWNGYCAISNDAAVAFGLNPFSLSTPELSD